MKLKLTVAVALSALTVLLPSGVASAAPSSPDAPVKITITRSSATRSAQPAAVRAPATFVVSVLNFSDTSFDQVVLSVGRFSVRTVQLIPQGPLRPLSGVQFEVANCADIRLYAVGVFIGGALVGSTGNQAPDASDGDLCSDQIDIG